MVAFFLFIFVEEGLEITTDDAPEKNPQYTTVYVGNLAPEARVIFFRLLTFLYWQFYSFVHRWRMFQYYIITYV